MSVRPADGTNSLAAAAAVFGALGFLPFLQLAAIGLGLVARREVRRTGQRGGGLAATGIGLGLFWVGLAMLLAAGRLTPTTG